MPLRLAVFFLVFFAADVFAFLAVFFFAFFGVAFFAFFFFDAAAFFPAGAFLSGLAGVAFAAFGKLDIAVNNAGTSATGPLEKLTDAVMQADLDLKLFAAIRLSRLVWPGMKQRKWGRIINVLNIGAKAPAAASTPTSVSRAAGMALTKALSNEGAAHNILVNAMLVGLIVSDQWVRRHSQKAPDTDFDAFTRDLAKGVPLGRMGTAEEFANLACFLASDQGSYITGTAINVDGGRSPVV